MSRVAAYVLILVGTVLAVFIPPSEITVQTQLRLLTASVYLVGGMVLLALVKR